QSQVAGPVLVGGAHAGQSSTGAPAVWASHLSASRSSVPSVRSASTAWLTHAVSAEPLSSTRPNCSGVPDGCGSWPTTADLSISAEVTKNAVGRSSTNPSMLPFCSAALASSLLLNTDGATVG